MSSDGSSHSDSGSDGSSRSGEDEAEVDLLVQQLGNLRTDEVDPERLRAETLDDIKGRVASHFYGTLPAPGGVVDGLKYLPNPNVRWKQTSMAILAKYPRTGMGWWPREHLDCMLMVSLLHMTDAQIADVLKRTPRAIELRRDPSLKY